MNEVPCESVFDLVHSALGKFTIRQVLIPFHPCNFGGINDIMHRLSDCRMPQTRNGLFGDVGQLDVFRGESLVDFA